jgi:hypothetical protein
MLLGLISKCQWLVLLQAALNASPANSKTTTRILPAEDHFGNSLIVDLGYSVYNGTFNGTTNLAVWKGLV